MKFTRTFALAGLFLVSCGQRPPPVPADLEANRSLPGRWLMDFGDSVGHFTSSITIASNGTYICHITVAVSNRASDRNIIQGRYEVKNGVLYDFVKTNSNTNMVTPCTFRTRILRMDGHELVVHNDSANRDVVFRRDQR
jgi:hypothetical protein